MSPANTPKYRRDAKENKSKYIKDKNGKSYSSKYVRTDEQKEAFREYREFRKNRPISASERYQMYLEREKWRNIALENEYYNKPEKIEEPKKKEPEEEQEEKREYIRAKGTSKDIFNTREADFQDEINYVEAEIQPEKLLRKTMYVRLVWTAALTLLAVVLQLPIFRFHIPFTPKFLSVDLSIFPSMFAAIAYGPVTGVVISLIKNILFTVITPNSIATAAANIILDTVFLVLSSILYMRGMFSPERYEKNLKQLTTEGKLKDNRAMKVFTSGIIASAVTALISVLTSNYILYPITIKYLAPMGFSVDILVEQYNSALEGVNRILPFTAKIISHIDSLLQGILVFNAPVTFVKLFFVTLVTAVLYKPLSRFLHYRPKTPPDIEII